MKNKTTNTDSVKVGMAWVLNNLSFIVFVTAIGMLYIFNAHNAERKLRKIETLKKEVEDAKSHYMDIKRDIMLPTTESELAKQLEDKGLKMQKGRSIVLKENKS